jgi:hypothetical protein
MAFCPPGAPPTIETTPRVWDTVTVQAHPVPPEAIEQMPEGIVVTPADVVPEDVRMESEVPEAQYAW